MSSPLEDTSYYLDYDGLGQVLKSVNTRFGNYLTAVQSNQKFATQDALDAVNDRLSSIPTLSEIQEIADSLDTANEALWGTKTQQGIKDGPYGTGMLTDLQLDIASYDVATRTLTVEQKGGESVDVQLPQSSDTVDGLMTSAAA